jgi:hypothetical protein
MVKQWNHAYIPLTDEWAIEDGDGWYGMRAKAYDSGNPDEILDCIQLEQAIDSLDDRHVKAALILRMFGWDEQDIGAVLSSRRTGRSLVESGISSVKRHERDKCNEG